jgi:ArsR family transcriptional regulator
MPDLPRLFGREVVARRNAETLAATVKAVADPGRIQILNLLVEHGEATVTDLIVSLNRLSQPTVSHHLRILHAAGLVSRRKDGVFVRYQVEHRAFRQLADALHPGRQQ